MSIFQVDNATNGTQKAKVKEEFLKTSKCLVEMLKNDKYNGKYFDRTEKESGRLCTKEGWFTCQVRQKLSFAATEWHLLQLSDNCDFVY